MKQNIFPKEWNEKKIQSVIDHYEQQTEDEAASEDEEFFEDINYTFMEIPHELVSMVRELIARHHSEL
jgi:hypothetical protein